MLGAEGVFIYQHREILGEQSKIALRQIGQVALINLIIGTSPGIDNWGHVGGLIGGAIFTLFAGPIYQIKRFQQQLQLEDQRQRILIGVVFVIQFLALILWVAGIIISRTA